MNKFKDYFLDPAYLKAQLTNDAVTNDLQAFRNVLSQIFQASDREENLSVIFPEMIKLLGHSDILVKKIACDFLIRHAHSRLDSSILAINSLRTLLDDSNPMMRALALKTFCSVNQEAFIEHSSQSVIMALHDKSAYVRRVAVMCCMRLHKRMPSFISDFGIVDKLYAMLRDSDPVVITNTLSTLDEILKEEGGIIINKKIAYHLLNHISSFTVWGQGYVLNLLKKYKTKMNDELFALLNALDTCLIQSNCCVVTHAINLFLLLTVDMPHLKEEVFKRARDSILLVLNSNNVELKHCMISFIRSNIEFSQKVFVEYYQIFFCRSNESLFLKKEKIAIIPHFVNDNNLNEIIDELGLYVKDNKKISLTAVEAIAAIIKQNSDFAEQGFKKLHSLCEMDYNYIFSDVTKIIQTLEFDTYSKFSDFLSLLICNENLLQVDDVEGKCAFLYIIGRYGSLTSDSVYILEIFCDNINNEHSLVKLSILSACMRIFLQKPAEMQDLLGSVLEHCALSDDREVKFRASYYFNLLKIDTKILKRMLTTSL